MDFGPGIASWKGNRVGSGFLFLQPPALSTSPHPNLLSLNSEGVAGCSPVISGEHLALRSACCLWSPLGFLSCLSLSGNSENPLLFLLGL